MFIALAVIFILFGIFTNGNFLSPRNLTNLINQTGYIAVMAVAMTLILIIRQIDLSVGYAAGFTGAIAAILMVKAGLPFYITIPIIRCPTWTWRNSWRRLCRTAHTTVRCLSAARARA